MQVLLWKLSLGFLILDACILLISNSYSPISSVYLYFVYFNILTNYYTYFFFWKAKYYWYSTKIASEYTKSSINNKKWKALYCKLSADRNKVSTSFTKSILILLDNKDINAQIWSSKYCSLDLQKLFCSFPYICRKLLFLCWLDIAICNPLVLHWKHT